MDKLLVRKDVYEELLEKGFGKRDLSKLTKKKITDKNGHTRTVYVRNGEQPAEVKQPKAQEGLTPEKKAKYEEMLEKVKAGSDENALFVGSRGMLNKKDAIAYLEGKLGKKTVNRAAQEQKIPIQGSNWISLPSGTRVTNEGAKEKMAKNNERIETLKKLMEGNTKADNIRLNSELRSLQNENEYIASRLPSDREEKKPVSSAAQGHLESDTPQNTDITAEDEKRFGKEALSGLSGKRTSSDETKEVDFKKWLEDNDIVPEEMAGESHAQIYKKVKKTGLDDDAAMKITGDIMAYNEAYKSEKPTQEQKYDDIKAFEEYKTLVTKENPTDEDHKRVGQLVMEHFNHSNEAWPGGAKLREESGMLEKRYNNLKEGDEITAYGRELRVVKKNEYNKTIKAEFVSKDGRKHTTDLSIMDIDDSSFDKDGKAKKSAKESKSSVNGFTLDDIYHHGSGKELKKVDDMKTAKGVVEMIARKYGATDKGREQLMDFMAYNIGGGNPLYDKLYEEYGVDAYDLDVDFEASHDLILNQAMGKDTKGNREQIEDSKNVFERKYRQMLEREG